MAYKATVIPVMIASPSDVSEERNIIREVIHDWNNVNAEQKRVVLMPYSWETHISPELGVRPQELINNRVLTNCDLLIGVFWTRLGTPTGVSLSGTVEEIEGHIMAMKPAMIYFSTKPIAPDKIDSEQYEALRVFKAKCMTIGLVSSYEKLEAFKELVYKHLQLILDGNTYLKRLIEQNNKETTDSNDDNQSISISDEAKELLLTASSTEDGHILTIAAIGGRFIQAGGKTISAGINGRENAKWEHALQELVSYRLVVDRGNKGEFFELTHEGWEFADKLRASQS